MSVYTTAELLASTQHHFKFDPLFLRLFFRETYPFTTEKVYLSQIPGLVNMALYVSPIVSGEVSQVTQCYDSPPVQAGFFVGGIWQYGFQVY